MRASVTSVLLAGGAMALQTIFSGQFDAKSLQADQVSTAAIPMEVLRQCKLDQAARDDADGLFDLDRYVKHEPSSCVSGLAAGYTCSNVDLVGFLRHQDTGSTVRAGNDIWGWTSDSGREIALLGQRDGTSFVEVLPNGQLLYLGRLRSHTGSSIWRDIKVIGHHAYIGSEADDHGLQIFDLHTVLEADPENPPTWSRRDLTAHFDGFGSSHNIVANEETNMVAAVGTSRYLDCNGGLWMIDVSDPGNPQDLGCVSDDGYVHDAQCVVYHGPDEAYQNHEICFNFNEDTLTIVDVSDRTQPEQLSWTSYRGATYTHQGWLAGDHTHLLLDDELDEEEENGAAADGHTTTYIVDVGDLGNPVFKGAYKSPQVSIDHNQYIVDGISYQANYGSGLRMVNISTIHEDPTGAKFEEIGFFDIRPEDDEVGGRATFNGAWSVYPWFASGHIVLSSIERGIYSLKYTG